MAIKLKATEHNCPVVLFDVLVQGGLRITIQTEATEQYFLSYMCRFLYYTGWYPSNCKVPSSSFLYLYSLSSLSHFSLNQLNVKLFGFNFVTWFVWLNESSL